MTDGLFDTNVFINWWRGDQGAVRLVEAVRAEQATASYSPITATELWVYEKLGRQEEIEYIALTSLLEEAVLTRDMAVSAGSRLRDFSDNRKRELWADALIAATAQARGEKIYSRDVKDLQRFYSNVQTY